MSLTKIITDLRNSRLTPNFAKMFSANVLAQAVGLLVYPILARLYCPADFGLFSVFMSLAGLCVILSTADYQNAIHIPASHSEAMGILRGSLLLLVGFVVLLTVTVLPFARPLSDALGSSRLAQWLWLLPIYVLMAGAWQLLNYWYTRHEQFNVVSAYQIGQNILAVALKCVFGVVRIGVGLVFATVISVFCALSFNMARHLRIRFEKTALYHDLHLLLSYRRFPLFSLPRSVINYLSSNLAVLLLAHYFGLDVSGKWGMALTLAFTPLLLVLNALYQVYFPHYAQQVRQRKPFLHHFRRSIVITLVVVSVVFVPLYFLLPWLVSLLMGQGWQLTATAIRCFLPWLALVCCAQPWSFLPDVFAQQKTALIIEITYLMLRLAALAAGIVIGDIIVLLICYSTVGVIMQSVQLLWYNTLIARHQKHDDIHQ